MAIITNFYNGDMARPIREIITQNFANVAKYIPNNFISLTGIERQNLPDDYKTHFKLVFDKEQEFTYRWSEVERNWKQYLIRARDEYARREANQNSETAFVDAEIGMDINGQVNPYTITFYNRAYDSYNTEGDNFEHHNKAAKDSIFLRALNIQYDSQYSVQTIIDKIISDFNALDDFVGDRSVLTDNPNINANTVTGALDEINDKTIDNKQRLDNIMDGTTPVPKADHADEADHALRADVADDAEMLGGQLPSYYATKAELDSTITDLGATKDRVEKNESDIAELQKGLNKTNQDLSDLTTRVDNHDTNIQNLTNITNTHTTAINDINDTLEKLDDQIGWEVLLGEQFVVGKNYAGKIIYPNFSETNMNSIVDILDRLIPVATSELSGKTDAFNRVDLIEFGTNRKISIDCYKTKASDETVTGDYVIEYYNYESGGSKDILYVTYNQQIIDDKYVRAGEPSSLSTFGEYTLPADLPDCTKVEGIQELLNLIGIK